jgi:flagellar basal body-associated protein FliL
MIIQLNDQYRLTSIPLNVVLEERKVILKGDKAGKEYYSTVGYYPNIEEALTAIFRKQIETSEVEGIQLLIQEIKTAVKTIMEQMRVLEVEG